VIARSPLRRLASPATALLPLRFFFGATFLWAGLDKLLDPAFLDAAAPTSLHAQLLAFARVSPLSGLIAVALPYAALLGLLIAIGEIGIGIGALTGLAFRVAAFGGMVLSILLWLTASWGTHPYYLGADLPYAVGWIALLIGGPGDRFVPARWRRDTEATRPMQASAGRSSAAAAPASPERRLLLQTATLAAVSAVVASFALPLRAMGVLTGEATRGRGLGEGSSPPPQPSPAPSTGPTATLPPGAIPVATVAAVTRKGSAAFTVPFDAPAPLPAGDPGVIVQLRDGSFVAFDAVCTHAGCTVEWDKQDRVLFCPCHDAIFDAEDGAAVLDGPAPTPLAALPLVIDVATGKIFLDPTA
jgi:thiosulfate dehydrogenase [quinone] large subunit